MEASPAPVNVKVNDQWTKAGKRTWKGNFGIESGVGRDSPQTLMRQTHKTENTFIHVALME